MTTIKLDLKALESLHNYRVASHMAGNVILEFQDMLNAASFVSVTECQDDATFSLDHVSFTQTFVQPVTVMVGNYTRYFKELP